MSLILGIMASSRLVASTAFESIATVTVGGGGASSITFSSIPSTYTHLQIRVLAKSNAADTADDCSIKFNTDTGTNYVQHALTGDGATAYAGYSAAAVLNRIIRTGAGNTNASMFGGGYADILDYTNTNKYKTVRALGGADINASGGFIDLRSLLWLNTSAINAITILPRYGTLWNQYSSFALYGIKGA